MDTREKKLREDKEKRENKNSTTMIKTNREKKIKKRDYVETNRTTARKQ